jgi:hypothetical protein
LGGYPTTWNDDDVGEHLSSDMMIFSDDGDTAFFVPVTGADLRKEKYRGEERTRAHVGVVCCGETGVGEPETWVFQDWPVPKRALRRFRALLRKSGKGEFLRRVILKIVRVGKSGDQKTRYDITRFSEVPDEARAVVDALTAEGLEAEDA